MSFNARIITTIQEPTEQDYAKLYKIYDKDPTKHVEFIVKYCNHIIRVYNNSNDVRIQGLFEPIKYVFVAPKGTYEEWQKTYVDIMATKWMND